MKKTILSLLVALMATTGATAQSPTVSGITWDPSTNSGTFDMPAYDVEVSTELWYKLDATETLDDNQTNYGMRTDFFLDRTLTKDVWNTFASPFAIPADKMEAYFGAGAKVRKLDNTTVEEGYVLNLNFATATSIEAGKPYIVKPTAANVDFSADGKEFEGVDLTAAEATADVTTYVNFVPTLGKTTVTGDPENILMMTTEGKLVHPSAVGNMKGFRGYFVMHDAPEGTRAFCVNFGDGETTGISSLTPDPSPKGEGSIYTLDGRRVNGQPTRKGMYIKSGKKVIIK